MDINNVIVYQRSDEHKENVVVSLRIIKRTCEGNNITMATSLPILQFEPFIIENGKNLNLDIS